MKNGVGHAEGPEFSLIFNRRCSPIPANKEAPASAGSKATRLAGKAEAADYESFLTTSVFFSKKTIVIVMFGMKTCLSAVATI